MEYLQELSLFRNPIESLPEDVFWDLRNLEKLNLCDCQIRKLPESIFKSLKRLMSIILSDNRLTHLPGNLFESNLELREISIDNNNLRKIAVNFTKIPNLQWLSLEDNKCVNTSLVMVNLEQLEDFQDKLHRNC